MLFLNKCNKISYFLTFIFYHEAYATGPGRDKNMKKDNVFSISTSRLENLVTFFYFTYKTI